MLRIILLSLVWAICSTWLVRPWFWKEVKNNDGISFDDEIIISLSIVVVYQVIIFVGIFLVSRFVYNIEGVRLYNSFLMIMLCFGAQSVWKYRTVMLTIATISGILWLQDCIVSCDINVPLKINSVPLNVTQTDENTDVNISLREIQSLFNADSSSGPTYNNGKYIYTVSGGYNGNGVVVIDKDNYTEAIFLPCSYELNVTDVSSKYFTQKLKELYITISDDNVPYGLFAVADKSWILGTYKVNGYIMFNLMTGEIQEFTYEELPIFVTNN